MLHFLSPKNFSFWPREGSGQKRVLCYFCRFSIKPRDVSGVKTAQISKFCWVFFFRPETSLGLKENVKNRTGCVFTQRRLWAKRKTKPTSKYRFFNTKIFISLTPETSVERHPTKFQNFAKYLKKKNRKKSGKRPPRIVYNVKLQ